ncbi:hypothetical protein ACFLRF_01635 [Candidatus Altiarchaeota archaeon]
MDYVSVLPVSIDYLANLPSQAMTGDVSAVTVVLIAVYLAILIVNKLTGLIIFVLKKIFLLAIVITAFYQFLLHLIGKIGSEGLTNDNMTLGVLGGIAGFIAIIIALYAAFHSIKTVKKDKDARKEVSEDLTLAPTEPDSGLTTPLKQLWEEQLKIKELVSLKSLKSDRHLGAVLAYLVIAEFGVFSSKTIAAPDEMVGLGFFTVFMMAAIFFVRQNYVDFRTGLVHYALACIVGGVLSILLGHFWGNYPLEQLLSLGYFKSDSLVALVTGLSVSLFMGGKG